MRLETKTTARVICNPTSGGGVHDPATIRRQFDGLEIEWIETRAQGDAEDAAREWDEGILIVAGGDGTINEVVNGLGEAGFPEDVTLALLPSGTGNDLAATLAIPEEGSEAIETIRRARVRTLDAAKVSSEGFGERYFLNVATGGFGAEASELNDTEMKGRWGKLSYLRATLEVARRFDVRETRLILDGEERRVRAVNIAVGNCRYAGGGWLAAPGANPEDGLLDVVVIEDEGMKEILSLTPALFGDYDYSRSEGVLHVRARSIDVETSPSGLEFTADGETVGDEPVSFEVIPHALKVIVGADYTPEVTES